MKFRIGGVEVLSGFLFNASCEDDNYVGASDYDPEFVASILQADAAPPEASFNNVMDMLDWLNHA